MLLYSLITCTPFYLAGCFVILKAFLHVIQYLYIEIANWWNPIDISERFGKNSYVLVTGASDGFGKGIAQKFAQLGLNLIITGRNTEKLTNVKTLIKKLVPSCKVEMFVCDFKDSLTPNFFEPMIKFTSKFDVSIVVNNVGMMYPVSSQNMSISDKDPSELINVMAVNMIPLAILHFYYEKKLFNRPNKSLFLDVCSNSIIMNFPIFEVYSATKMFGWYLTNSLSYSAGKSNLEGLCYTIGWFESNLLNESKLLKDLPNFNIPEKSLKLAESIIKCIGLTRNSLGVLSHLMQSAAIYCFHLVGDTLLVTFLLRKFLPKEKKN